MWWGQTAHPLPYKAWLTWLWFSGMKEHCILHLRSKTEHSRNKQLFNNPIRKLLEFILTYWSWKYNTKPLYNNLQLRKDNDSFVEKLMHSTNLLQPCLLKKNYWGYLQQKSIFFLQIVTSPGKKQQCFLSICLPKVICRRLNLMWRVSMISDSHARGWLLRADSLLGIFALIDWNLFNILFCKRLNVEFNIPLHIKFNRRFTCRCK